MCATRSRTWEDLLIAIKKERKLGQERGRVEAVYLAGRPHQRLNPEGRILWSLHLVADCSSLRAAMALDRGPSPVERRSPQKQLQPNSDEPNSEYWRAIWDAVSDTTPSVNNLKNFEQWTRVHVLAGGLQATKGLSAYVQRLDTEEDPTSRTVARPLHQASYLYFSVTSPRELRACSRQRLASPFRMTLVFCALRLNCC